MREFLEQLTERLKAEFPQVRECCLTVSDGDTRQTAEQAVKSLLPEWKGKVEIDGYGAPYLLDTENCPVSISVTSEQNLHLCLAVIHDGSIKGVGLDICSSREFLTVFREGEYRGGRLFTWLEQQRLEGMTQLRGQQELAEIFSGKEAAFKALNEELRRKIPLAAEVGRNEELRRKIPSAAEVGRNKELRHKVPATGNPEYYAEFLELEVCEIFHGRRYARPFGRTRDTMAFLGWKEVELVTVQAGELALTAGVIFSENNYNYKK